MRQGRKAQKHEIHSRNSTNQTRGHLTKSRGPNTSTVADKEHENHRSTNRGSNNGLIVLVAAAGHERVCVRGRTTEAWPGRRVCV